MKFQKIYMKAWLDCHARVKREDSDQWYLDLANDLLPLISQSCIYRDATERSQQHVALILSLYLEDCVADEGHWREFTNWHHDSYGRYLPFYTLTDAYLPDEINVEDVAFLLWAINSPVGEDYELVENPMDADLLELSELIYKRLDEAFEQAPISNHLADDWLMEAGLMDVERTELPVALPGEKMPENVARFMEASGGESLMYFDSYLALKMFFIHSLKWEDKEDELLPDLMECENFVLYANPKGLLIGPDVATYFADRRNPLYDAEASEEEAYELFTEQGLFPFDLLKYAMKNNLLPDAQLPFENGKTLLHDNWDFLARWFLGEYYEGN